MKSRMRYIIAVQTIKLGGSVGVATPNVEKTVQDFYLATGFRVALTATEDKDVYNLKLIGNENKDN